MRALLLTVLLGAGCHPKVRKAFDDHLHDALAPPARVEGAWLPDATVQLSEELVADAVEASWRAGGISGGVRAGGHALRTRLDLADLLLDLPSAPCGGCTGLVARFDGDVAVDGDTLGVDVAVRADLELFAAPAGDAARLRLRPEIVSDVRVDWDGVPPADVLSPDVDPVGRWLEHRLVDELPATGLGRVGRRDMPVIATRVDRGHGGPTLDVRFAGGGDAPAPRHGAPAEGWTARVTVPTVLGLARRAALARGPRHGLWVDPTSLTLSSERFELGVRLWRLAGGWFVDLAVSGPLRVVDGRVAIEARELREVAASKGARRLDPIEAVREARVLAVVADAITAAAPRAGTGDLAGGDAVWRVTSLAVEGDVVTLRGTATFTPSEASALLE